MESEDFALWSWNLGNLAQMSLFRSGNLKSPLSTCYNIGNNVQSVGDNGGAKSNIGSANET